VNEIASRVTQEATGEAPPRLAPQKNQAAVELGRLGGQKGGRARAEKLSADERSKIARRAAQARWSKGK
jgi:hypothetical protein